MNRLIRFWKDYASRYKYWYALGVVCLIATNLLTVAIPRFIQYAIDSIDKNDDISVAIRWGLIVSLSGLAVILVRTLSRTLFFNPGRTIEFRVKSDLFDHLLRLPRKFFDKNRPGDLISRGTNDANAMRALVGFGTLQLFNVSFILILTLGRMLQLNMYLTALCAGPLVIGAIVMRHAVIKLWTMQYEFITQLSVISDRILESYAGVGVIQSFGAQEAAQARFEVENRRLLDLAEQMLRIRSWILPIVSVASQVCVVIVLFAGGRMVMASAESTDPAYHLTIGELSAFIAYVAILATGLRSLGFLIGAVQRGYLSLGRIYEILDSSADRTPAISELPSPSAGGHGVEIRDLSFTYPGSEDPVLRGVNLNISPGQTLGIFGPTGSGKSTLLRLIARTYDPPEGTIMLSGVDARDIEIQEYWRSVAMVRQEPFLFSKTVRENIALSIAPEQVDEEKMQSALRDASLEMELGELSDGLETIVGERGVTLSGGQRQRVALSRSLYRDFDLLLLDDVMSAVDHATEEYLIEAIYRRMAGRSCVLVSHRISVLSHADHVVVLDDGRVIDSGTHEALLQRPGPYRKAWRLQKVAEQIGLQEAPK